MHANGIRVIPTVDPERGNGIPHRVPEHVRATHGADGAIVLNILHGQMFRLNFIGSRILELLKQGLEAPEIAEELACEFGIERVAAEADVREFLEALEKRHLLTVGTESSSLPGLV